MTARAAAVALATAWLPAAAARDARADLLQVGPGQTYATPCDALAVAKAGVRHQLVRAQRVRRHGRGRRLREGRLPVQLGPRPDDLTESVASFLFVSPGAYDYPLQSGSPAIGHAVPAGTLADAGTSLAPAFEYVQPVARAPRAADDDVGAFEYASPGAGAGDAGAEAGTPAADDAGAPGPADADAGAENARDATGGAGCGCSQAGLAPDARAAWPGVNAAIALGATGRRRRSRTTTPAP